MGSPRSSSITTAGGNAATVCTRSVKPASASCSPACAAASRASSRMRGSMAATVAGVKKPATTLRMPPCVPVSLLASTGGNAKPTRCSTRNAGPSSGVTATSALAGLKSAGRCRTSRTDSGSRTTRYGHADASGASAPAIGARAPPGSGIMPALRSARPLRLHGNQRVTARRPAPEGHQAAEPAGNRGPAGCCGGRRRG